MRLVWKANLRHLWRHPWLAGLCVLGIALGVAVALATDLAARTSQESFQSSTQAVVGRASHQIVGGSAGVPEDTFRQIVHGFPEVQAAPVIELSASVEGAGSVRVLGVDPLAEGPLRGTLPVVGTDGGASDIILVPGAALVSRQLAIRMDKNIGDPFSVSHGGKASKLSIAGFLEGGDPVAKAGLRDAIFVDVATAQERFDHLGRFSRIDLRGPDASIEVISGQLPPQTALVSAASRSQALASMTEAFQQNLRVMSLLAVVVGMFLIYNTMTFLVVQRRPLHGVLRAAGVSRAQLAALVLGETFILGAVGTALGVVLGVVLARGLLALVSQTINDLYHALDVSEVSLSAGALAVAVSLGLGASLVSVAVPATEAARAPPRAVLSRAGLERNARRLAPVAFVVGALSLAACAGVLAFGPPTLAAGYLALFGGLAAYALMIPLLVVALCWGAAKAVRRAGPSFRLAVRGIVAQLSRTGVCIAALVIAVSTMLGVGLMIDSFRNSVESWLTNTLRADIYVSMPSVVASRSSDAVLPGDTRARLAALEGVDFVSTNRTVNVLSDLGPIRLVALEVDERSHQSFELMEGDPVEAWARVHAGGAAMVSEPFALRHGLRISDQVTLRTPVGQQAVTVAAIYRDYGSEQGYLLMDRRHYDRLYDDPGFTALGVFVRPNVSVEAVEQRVRAALGEREMNVRSNRVLRDASMEVFDRTFAITGVLRLLTAIVAFIGVVAALMSLQLERGREFAVLRAAGMTPGQLRRMVVGQSAFMGLFAGLLALPLGWSMARVLSDVINRRSFGWTIDPVVMPERLLEAVVVAFVAAVAASVYPAWRLGRASVSQGLREE